MFVEGGTAHVTARTRDDFVVDRPGCGSAVTVASGLWKKLFDCNIDGFVHRLKERKWTWKDSVRYTSACQTAGCTSGSPVVDR